MVTRRTFLGVGTLAVASCGGPRVLRAAPPLVVHMRASERGEQVWFDPVGLYVERGQAVRWMLDHDVHTTTAYHPRNDHHSLRIPAAATPWDSGFLVRSGAHFDVTFTIEGVYDYYCLPHEEAGMVGRLVVGKAAGPGALPFDYFKGKPGARTWRTVPVAAQQAFPSVARILREKTVHLV